MKKSFLTNSAILFLVCLGVSACSGTSVSEPQTPNKASSVTPATNTRQNNTKHIHMVNECTDVVTHSHPNGEKDHEHTYNCESTNSFISNAHVHPATGVTGSTRHVHPNGANPHKHH